MSVQNMFHLKDQESKEQLMDYLDLKEIKILTYF